MSVNIGKIYGSIELGDGFTAPSDQLLSLLPKLSDSIDKLVAKVDQWSKSTEKSSKKTVDETTKIQQAYNKLAAQLDPVEARTQKYQRAQETLNKALEKGIIDQTTYNARLSQAQGGLQQAEHWTTRLGNSIGGSLTSQFTRFFAVTAVLSTISATVISISHQLVDATLEAESIQKKIELAVARSGNASGLAAEEVLALADSYSRLTGLDDELIAGGLAVELKFNRLGRDIFPQVAQAALDFATVTGTDIPAAFEKVSKMVNNPLRALSLLSREGYAVGASQAAMVKEMLRTNDIAGAQGIILDILKSQYGNAAAEMRDTMGGALTALSTSWENMLEKLGEDNTGPFRDVVERMILILDGLTDKIDNVSLGWLYLRETLLKTDIWIQNVRGGDDAQKKIKEFNEELRKTRQGIGENLAKQGVIPEELAKKFGFLTESHKKAARGAIEQTEAESRLSAEADKVSKAIQGVTDSIGKMVAAAEDQIAQYQAAIQGQKALNEEILKQKVAAAILREEEKLRAVNKSLTEQQRREIEKSVRATEKFKEAANDLVQSWGRLKSLSNIEITPIDFSKIPSIQQSIMEIGVSIHASVNEDFDKEWTEFGNQIKDGLKSSQDAYKEYELKVKIARDLGFISAIEGEMELARVRQAQMGMILDDWTSLANSLSNLFGGLFSKIADGLSKIQSAYQTGNQVGGMLQTYAGAGSWASGMGTYFAAFTAFYELTKMWTASTERQRGRTYLSGYEAQAQMRDGTLTFGGAGKPGQALSTDLQVALDGVLSAIGGFLKDLPAIEIKIRNDANKFQAYVAGVWIGTFGTAEEAISASITQALSQATFIGVGPEILRALEQSISSSLDELQHNLEIASAAQRDRLGDVGATLAENIGIILQRIEAEKRLGLSTEDTIRALEREIQTTKNRTLGIDDATSRQLADIKSLADGMAQASQGARATVQREIDALMAQIAQMEARGGPIDTGGYGPGGGGPGGGGMGGGPSTEGPEDLTPAFDKSARSDWDESLRLLKEKLAEYLGQLDKIPEALSDQEINMGIFDALFKYVKDQRKYQEEAVKYAKFKVDIEFELIKAQLIALGKWEQFMGMFDDAYAAAQRAAGLAVRGGGSGRSGDREGARSFLEDRRFELQLAGMDDVHAQLARLNKDYDEQLKAAGKDKKLREELLALRKQETDLIIKENQKDVIGRFQELIGKGDTFSQLHDRFVRMGEDIKAAGFGAARTARMLNELTRAEQEAINLLGRQSLGNLFTGLAQYIDDQGIKQDALAMAAKIKFDLDMIMYKADFELLKQKHLLTQKEIDNIEDLFDYIDKHTPDFSGGGAPSEPPIVAGAGSGGNPNSGEGYWESGIPGVGRWIPTGGSSGTNPVDQAKELLKRYMEDARDSLTNELSRIEEDFKTISDALGNTAEVIAAKNKAIEMAMQDAFSGISDFYDSLLNGPNSHLSVQEQYNAAMSKYTDLVSKLQSGDRSVIPQLENLLPGLQGLAEQMFGTSTGEFTTFKMKLLGDLGGLLGGVGLGPAGSSLDSGLAKVLEFSAKGLEDMQASFSTTMPDLIGKSSDRMAEVINLASVRREKLLQKVVEAVDGFHKYVRDITATPLLQPIGYG